MNIRKSNLLATLCATVVAALPSADAGVRFAQGELNAQATVQIAETSRVSPRADSTSDLIYTFTPALTYHRESGKLNLNSRLSLPMRRYDTADRLDSNSIDFSLSGNVPYGTGPRLSGTWNVSYFDGVTASFLTNRNLDTQRMNAALLGNYRIGNRLSLRSRLGYNERSNSGVDTSFRNENETTFFTAGVHMRELLGRIGVYTEYRIQKRKTTFGQINQQVDDTDDGINFGITGQVLPERWFPKLEADLSFGFHSVEASNRPGRINTGRSNRLTLDGSLRYPLNPRTNIGLNFDRNLIVTDDDRTVERTRTTLTAQYTPRQKLSFNGSVGVSSNDFILGETQRNDDVLLLQLGARYSIRPNWSAAINYNMRDSDSNVSISDYSSSVISLSTTISY